LVEEPVEVWSKCGSRVVVWRGPDGRIGVTGWAGNRRVFFLRLAAAGPGADAAEYDVCVREAVRAAGAAGPAA
jgi:hypothetical protein